MELMHDFVTGCVYCNSGKYTYLEAWFILFVMLGPVVVKHYKLNKPGSPHLVQSSLFFSLRSEAIHLVIGSDIAKCRTMVEEICGQKKRRRLEKSS